MRRICIFIPAHTIPNALALGATANTHPPTTAPRSGARSTRVTATPQAGPRGGRAHDRAHGLAASS